MNRNSLLLFCFLCLLLFVLVPAGSARATDLMGPRDPDPYAVFSTMSAETPAQGNASAGVLMEKSSKPDFYRFSTQIAMGLLDEVEFGINIPYVDNSHSGLEDMAVWIKHRFFDEGRYGPSVAYLITSSIESSTEELSTDSRIGAGIIASKRVGPVKGHANLFYALPGDDALEEELRFSVGMAFSAAHNFDLLAEVFGRSGHDTQSVRELEVRFGYRIRYGEGVSSTLGVGMGLSDREPDFRLMASVALDFPRLVLIEKVYEEEE